MYAWCDVRPTVFAAPFSLSLALSSRAPFCTFSLTPSNFLFIVFVASLLSLPSFSLVLFFCPSPPSLSSFLSLLLSYNTAHTRAPHYHSREPRARNTTHMAGRPLLLRGVCGPTSCRGLCHVAPRPQRHTTRAVLSREPRTRHQSQTNRETGPTEIALSLPGSACDAFSLPLFPILSLPFFFSHSLSIYYSLFFSSFFLSFRSGEHARYITRIGNCVHPRCLYHPQPRVILQCCVFMRCHEARDESVSRWDISFRFRWFIGEKIAWTSRAKCSTRRVSLPHYVEMETSTSVSWLCRYSIVYRRRCGLCIGVVCQRVNDVAK